MQIRGFNFGAGPATLPEEILKQTQNELLNWQGQGMSILEIGHRTSEFQELLEEIEQDFRDLLTIPEDYEVLFLGGPARSHFALIPLNFLPGSEEAGYLITGLWSELAFKEACRLKNAYCINPFRSNTYTSTPSSKEQIIKKKSAYFYYTTNETVNGVRFAEVPHANGIPLIVDMTSSLLSEPINIRDYAFIFAGAQKNIANAGMTMVIAQKTFLEKIPKDTLPAIFDYQVHTKHKSLYATPPGFNCYVAGKMFKWIKRQGGVDALYQENCRKAKKLYEFIDESTLYTCNVDHDTRSIVNIVFHLTKPELENEFLMKAKACGLLALKGHRTVGGLRASLYNAMPMAGVDALIKFMHDFSRKNG